MIFRGRRVGNLSFTVAFGVVATVATALFSVAVAALLIGKGYRLRK
ncbi:MAG: hypothetical protein K0A93_07715 [Desulfuromonadaceae bacterium]|nr:hypothetical protein [Desulfuromonadaceae bacterium]